MVIRIKILLNYWIGGFALKRLLRSQNASLGGVSGGWLCLRPAFFEILSKGQLERNENHHALYLEQVKKNKNSRSVSSYSPYRLTPFIPLYFLSTGPQRIAFTPESSFSLFFSLGFVELENCPAEAQAISLRVNRHNGRSLWRAICAKNIAWV